MSSFTDLLPHAETGRAEFGDLCAMLAREYLDFRVETFSSDAGFDRAIVTVHGALGVEDALEIIQWARADVTSRSVAFPVSKGDVLRVTLSWRMEEGGDGR